MYIHFCHDFKQSLLLIKQSLVLMNSNLGKCIATSSKLVKLRMQCIVIDKIMSNWRIFPQNTAIACSNSCGQTISVGNSFPTLLSNNVAATCTRSSIVTVTVVVIAAESAYQQHQHQRISRMNSIRASAESAHQLHSLEGPIHQTPTQVIHHTMFDRLEAVL